MSLKIHCAGCKAALGIPEKFANKRIKCPKCGFLIQIPPAPVGNDAQSAPVPDTSGKKTDEPVSAPENKDLVEIKCRGCGRTTMEDLSLGDRLIRCPQCKFPIKIKSPG